MGMGGERVRGCARRRKAGEEEITRGIKELLFSLDVLLLLSGTILALFYPSKSR